MTRTKIIRQPRPEHQCKCCNTKISEKPQIEKVTVDGISYKVYRWQDGTNVESPCSCFGSTFRAHSTEYCPWLKKRSKHVAQSG